MTNGSKISRRQMLRRAGGCAAGVSLAGGLAWLLGTGRAQAKSTVWQIDPNLCNQCGSCATHCVLKTSAVKCVHAFALCGYCDLCTGFLDPRSNERNSAAENQLCPFGAIQRTGIEDPYYEYTIDETKCIGCGRCVKGCAAFGNGSLFLQVRHDRCVNCNKCSIAVSCPANAFVSVPADKPYLLKSTKGTGQ